jgi:hypothetical protein
VSKSRRLLTNFSKGELSPRLEGRPDLATYFEGASAIENFILLRQGGLERRSGTRFITEVKFSDKDTILIPFESSVSHSYVIEVGNKYMRFYSDGSPIMSGGVPVEIVTPYTEGWLRFLHFTQSVDVLFIFAVGFNQHTLSRVSDTEWFLSPIVYDPPPSFEADTDISQGPVDTSALIIVERPLAGTVGGIVQVVASVRPGISVLSIQFQRNAINFGALITALPYSFYWDTTLDVDFTTYTITAILTDSLGAVSTSVGVIVTVDNVTPPPPPDDYPPPSFHTGGGDGSD